MSKKRCSPDNLACEGLFGKLKDEVSCGEDRSGWSVETPMAEIDAYIRWHNGRDNKLTLDVMSPVEYVARAIRRRHSQGLRTVHILRLLKGASGMSPAQRHLHARRARTGGIHGGRPDLIDNQRYCVTDIAFGLRLDNEVHDSIYLLSRIGKHLAQGPADQCQIPFHRDSLEMLDP